ncbi:hypothetical protein R1sor_007063 [Riccia sorocarpa]|uniref:Uncharacterized protein n=1 Tax=Riccia sorocarpa TaxID=122646 RepID=A0ABD3HS92_9MARC
MSLDGGGERHVGPPRTLEIQKFTAARSGEVQGLYATVKNQVEAAGGDSSSFALARHLRRRTTSHNRHLPYWIRNQRRKNRLGHSSQNWNSTKKKEAPSVSGAVEKRKVEKSPPSRRVRRRVEFQQVRRGDDVVQPDGTRRLATHVWHAKRFPMKKCWGYSLPEGLPGRGGGSRAVLKWVKEAATLHDASYYGLIELQGSSEAIARALEQTVKPAIWCPSSGSPSKKAEAHGLLSGNAVLYHVGKAPYDAIAPITFLWRPPPADTKLGETEPEQVNANISREERQLWLWVHPGAYESALHCLEAACKKQGKDNLVTCRSRNTEFARFEILGSQATAVIRKVMHPTSRKLGTPSRKLSGQSQLGDAGSASVDYPADSDFPGPKNLEFFSKAEFLPASAVLALDVLDPRCKSSCSLSGGLEAERGIGDGCTQGEYEDIYSPKQWTRVGGRVGVDDTQEGPVDGEEHSLPDQNSLNFWTEWLNMAEEGLSREVSDSECLWNMDSGAKGAMLAPMSEKKLCKQRHEERKKFLKVVNPVVSISPNSKTQQNRSFLCPVLLLRMLKSPSSASGWTIILPIKWAHAFWIPLVFAGGRVIGLRERHWLATNAGIPHFPHDFPDCFTYAQLLAANMASSDEANMKRPPAKRAPCSVVSPLQASILRVFEHSKRSRGNIHGSVSSGAGLENILCTPGNEESIQNLQELEDMSTKIVDTLPQEILSAPDDRHNDVVVTASADDTVPVHVEENSGTAAPQACSSAEVSFSSQSVLVAKEGSTCPLKMDQLARCMKSTGVNAVEPVNHKLAGEDGTASKAGLPTDGGVFGEVHEEITGLGYQVDRAADRTGGSRADLFSSEPLLHEEVMTATGADVVASATPQSLTGRVTEEGDTETMELEVVTSEAGSGFMQPESSVGVISHHDGGGARVTEPAALESNLIVEDAQTNVPGGGSSILFSGNTVSSAPAIVDSVMTEVDVALSSREDVPPVSTMPVDSLPETRAMSGSPKHDDTSGRIAEEKEDRAGTSDSGNTSKGSVSFFIARTQDVLLDTLNRSGFQNALFLHQGVKSKGTIKDALNQGMLRWAASSEGVTRRGGNTSARVDISDEEKICYIRVLVSVHRKGAMEEGAVLFAPNEEDQDMFLRFREWQGPVVMQPRSVKRKRNCKKKKVETVDGDASAVERIEGIYENADAYCEAWSSNRRSVGLITSCVPRGSTGPCIGICDIGALMMLRGGQSGDPRWWDSRDIFVLAGNKYSSKLRPALISLPLERAECDIEWL